MFRTELNISPSNTKISHQSKILSIGSCFADSIGQNLIKHKFDCLTNPFGVIFNPISLIQLLRNKLNDDHLVHYDGLWKHLDVHSELSTPDKEDTLTKIKKQQSFTQERVKYADIIIITFGTAITYKYLPTGLTVANCHKLPSSSFEKRLLTPNDIIEEFEQLELPQNCQIILTVSPVRHLKETLELNSVSKSILRYACHELNARHENIHYFPAYEILLDDLRDYRFYEKDMLHPSEEAKEYIWSKFSSTYFSEDTIQLNEKLDKLFRALNHKPFHPDSPQHQKFLQETKKQAKMLSQHINLDKELSMLP